MNNIPEFTEAQDDRDFQEYMAGEGIGPERAKWLDDFREALRELGFDEWSVEDVIVNGDLKYDLNMDPVDYIETLRFCDCGWIGPYGDLEQPYDGKKYCPDCGALL